MILHFEDYLRAAIAQKNERMVTMNDYYLKVAKELVKKIENSRRSNEFTQEVDLLIRALEDKGLKSTKIKLADTYKKYLRSI
jgi:hypothetical protein